MSPRVLQVILSLNPGGTERLVMDLVRRLHREIPMSVCCLDDEGAWAGELRDEGIGVTALQRDSGFRPGLGRCIASVAARHGANLLHCHHYSPFVYGCLARVVSPRLKVLFTEHGRLSDAPPSSRRRLANRLLARVPRGVFAVSDDLKRHIVQEGFGRDAVQVVYNGIDVGEPPGREGRRVARARLGVPDEAIVVGTVARLDPVKDLGTLIRAVAAVQIDPPLRLLVVGDGAERQTLERQAEEAGLAGRACFVGHQDAAREWLAACDIYANSSISEGVSLTILEAMAASLPVIATAVGGTPEVLTPECGRLVPARDVEAMAGAMASLAGDADLRRALGAAARQRVADRFTIERMVSEYRRVYLEAA